MDDQKFVFFLKFEEKIPKFFYSLSRLFDEKNIKLVPVSFDELKELTTFKKQDLVIITRNMAEKQSLDRYLKKYLSYAILNEKLCLHLVSAFREIDEAAKARKKNCYHHFKLPVDLITVVNFISMVKTTRDDLGATTWPGGRRAKLPSR